MSPPAPRRPSRTTTPKPRKLAGQSRTDGLTESAAPTDRDEPTESSEAAETQPGRPTRTIRVVQPTQPTRATPAEEEPGRRSRGPLVAGFLVVVVAVLALLLVGQVTWFIVDTARDDEAVAIDESGDAEAREGTIAVPPDRPVVMEQLAVQDGLEAAANAATSMFARTWDAYDQEVDAAVELMTAEFAGEYRTTTDDVKQEFVRNRTEVEVGVVAQGVVRANDAELEALIFLNQYVFKGEGKDATTQITPYRALLTMVHTDRGWFVDDVQTK